MAEDAAGAAAQRWADAQRAYAKFVARYRTDARFRAAADADPAEALRRFGIPVEPGVRVRLVPVDPDERVVLVPTREIDWELATAAQHCFGTAGCLACAGCAGGTFGCGGTFGTAGCWNPCFGPSEPEDPKEPEPKEPEPKDPEPEDPQEPVGDSGTHER